VPVPPVGIEPVKGAGAVPLQIDCAEPIVFEEIVGNTVIVAAADATSAQLPLFTYALTYKVPVNVPMVLPGNVEEVLLIKLVEDPLGKVGDVDRSHLVTVPVNPLNTISTGAVPLQMV
jgi:hypothetical protein